MTPQKPDAEHQVPVLRSDRYPPEADVDGEGPGGVVHEALEYLRADPDVIVVGRVTIAAGVRDPNSSRGAEYDLTPADARALARDILVAADTAESGATGSDVIP